MTAPTGHSLPNQRRASARAVFLVGFMGSGKSTVGPALARTLGWEFIDLDRKIEARAGCSVAEIFRSQGEPQFRELEHLALRELLQKPEGRGTVVALGGGAWTRSDNAELIRSGKWPTVFLDAPAEVLWERCLPEAATRPLLADPASFRQLYEQRRPTYLQGTERFDTSGKTADAVADEIAKWLRQTVSSDTGGRQK
jgi:shikimate kinase